MLEYESDRFIRSERWPGKGFRDRPGREPSLWSFLATWIEPANLSLFTFKAWDEPLRNGAAFLWGSERVWKISCCRRLLYSRWTSCEVIPSFRKGPSIYIFITIPLITRLLKFDLIDQIWPTILLKPRRFIEKCLVCIGAEETSPSRKQYINGWKDRENRVVAGIGNERELFSYEL